ncbi:MAG TPA: phosphotransferase [Vicinamibacteria bacterium]|nr:phosphotransferase [Vicinamibacteria bacterium]
MIDSRVERFLTKPRSPELSAGRLARLAGDASNRLYYRLEAPGGRTRVLALLPGPFDPRELPFLDVSKLFEAIPLRVPEIYEVDGELGILLLEDLGDVLLQDDVERGSSEARKNALYREATSMLARLQARGAELSRQGARFGPLRIAFDAKKFGDELAFFRLHFVEGFSARALTPPDRENLDTELRALASELAAQPFALCHRDYHSRNLIPFAEEIAVIDHQDARMGPRCYDLASLLNDSYVELESPLVGEMQDFFAAESGADVRAEYDVAALQRNLKALGTFGFQISERGNDVYRRYIPRTLSLVRANLEANPRWDRLRSELARHLPELQ